MDKKKKPIYKKWWFWLVAFLVFGFVVGQTSDNEEQAEDVEQEPEDEEKAKEEPKEESKSEETEEVDKKEEEEPQEEEQTIEINKEIEFDIGNLTLDIESVYVEGNTLSFGFWWNYWSSYDEAHFLLFAYPVVTQGGEELEEVDEKDSLLRQTKKGVDSRVDLEYELKNDSPVEIKIKTTSDEPEEEVIEIDIK